MLEEAANPQNKYGKISIENGKLLFLPEEEIQMVSLTYLLFLRRSQLINVNTKCDVQFCAMTTTCSFFHLKNQITFS